ncbi:MAG TPA: hypothetical protein PKY37_05040 [Paludibacteraceae bacterium]|nr:hypothetical protein [Paludibacteraceae bacterium]
MAQMKDGHLNDLLEILGNKDKFLIPYSTSHIGDILSSYADNEEQKTRIDNDLNFISSLTDNVYLANNGKKVFMDKKHPKELYQQRLNEKDLMKDYSLDSLEAILNENELTKGIGKTLISLIKSIPIEENFKKAFDNPESSEYLDKMFPGLKENLTMEGFFKCFGKMYNNLNNKEDYKILREVTQNGLGINRDKIFDNENPYSIIDEAQQKFGVDVNKFIDNKKHAPEWFNKISNEYIQLDMYGYQEDKVIVRENKRIETFRNTTEDAFHSAFASTCNFYVINDKKSYKKTKQVYDRLQINTVVFKPNEFIDYYNKYLDIKNTADYFQLAVKLIKSDNFFESKDNIGNQRIYLFPFFLFDFFNKIVVAESENDENPIFLLSKFSPTNGLGTTFKEIEILVNMLIEHLGLDNDKKGVFSANEFNDGTWDGRTWDVNEIQFRLLALNGYVQLYFNILN